MKTLLISESQDILTSYADFFKSMGYENLCYRWLLKAMDNLEEIQPDVVFINASDYPRHWKTIVQYIRASGFCNPVVLLTAEYLNDDDEAKARFLDIYCITSSIDDEQTRQNLRKYLTAQCEDTAEKNTVPEPQVEPERPSKTQADAEQETQTVTAPETEVTVPPAMTEVEAKTESEPVTETESADVPVEKAETEKPLIEKTEDRSVPQKTSAFTFIHPVSKIEITGPLLKYEHPLLFFRPCDKTSGKQLRLGQKARGIINHDGEILNVSVQVQGLDGDIAELCILI